jgi:hypothetical protein
MLVVRRVPLAFVAGNATGRRARFDRCAQNAGIGRGLPRQDATRGDAHVAAVEAKADAADQLEDVRLGKRGIGAARAGPRALRALGDTALEQVTIERARRPMGLHDLANSHCAGHFHHIACRLRRGSADGPSRRCTTAPTCRPQAKYAIGTAPKELTNVTAVAQPVFEPRTSLEGRRARSIRAATLSTPSRAPATTIRRRVRGSSSLHFLLTTTAPCIAA